MPAAHAKAVTDPNSGEGELKLYARAVAIEDEGIRDAAAEAWWVGRSREDARVFTLEITGAACVTWDLARGEMTVRSWSRRRGARTYP